MPKILSHRGWGKAVHIVVIAAILFTHILPEPSFAPPFEAQTELPDVQVIPLTDDDSADEYAERLGAQIRSRQAKFGDPAEVGWKVSVDWVHIAGQSEDPRIKRIVTILARQGIKTNGDVVTQADFEKNLSETMEPVRSGDDPANPMLHLLERGPVPQTTFLKRVKSWGERVFGLPKGWTYFKLYCSRVFRGRVDPRVEYSDVPVSPSQLMPHKIPADHALAVITAGFAAYAITENLNPGKPILSEALDFSKPIDQWLTSYPSVTLFLWVYAYQIFFCYKSMARFVGISPYFKKTTDGEYELQHDAHNRLYWYIAALGPEILINVILTWMILSGKEMTWASLAVVAWTVIRNAALATFAFQPADTVAGQLLAGARRAKKGSWERFSIKASEHTLRFTWWNLIYPPLKSFDLIHGMSILGSIPFLLFGLAGIGIDSIRNGWFMSRKLPVSKEGKEAPLSCGDYLLVQTLQDEVQAASASGM